jgi:hypothetical protein
MFGEGIDSSKVGDIWTSHHAHSNSRIVPHYLEFCEHGVGGLWLGVIRKGGNTRVYIVSTNMI